MKHYNLLNTDEQTIEDLRIFAKRDNNGIYDIYNHTNTRGGEKMLEELFRHPLSDREAINDRSRLIEQLAHSSLRFPFANSLFDLLEKYLINAQTLSEKDIQHGVTSAIGLLQELQQFITSKEVTDITAYTRQREHIAATLADPVFAPALRGKQAGKISYTAIAAFDILFRTREREKIEHLLGYIYELDVFLSVAKVARERGLIFPRALDKGTGRLKLEGVYHPALPHPVKNDLSMDTHRNLVFLTGANMAGKSTLLRSLSTALYLAHIGFPVAAGSMEFSVMDGIYTTINLPDNLGIGASHFYAEVLRLKKIAVELGKGSSIFVIFDELFRGTNVKDAKEATVAVTRGFARKKTSLFIISSHIVEAGEQLADQPGIGFQFLPTRMNGHTPEYTYTLEQGISGDRHGMIIIRNEGILDTLKNGYNPAKATPHKTTAIKTIS